MRIRRSTLVGTAVAIALFGQNDPARAADDPNAKSDVLEEIVVSGIRYSQQQSLDAKRAADTHVEVITAEDIGKMPDKNVADSLARVTGVTISSASANEGGFDENDRVSMRGTNPSLTQTLLNGHAVAAGDWFILNQVEAAGRSVSYTLLPSELVNQVVVHKSSEASLVEGGVTGSVDIITRRPLDFKEPVTFSASAGFVYAELPDKTDPQLSALFNYKNDAGNFGILVQAFSQKRHLRRDGVEVLGYNTIAPGSPLALSNPDLSGVQYPNLLGAALFEQERDRKGGLVDIQFKATDNVTIDGQFFTSKLDATNYNRNYMFWGGNVIGGGVAPLPGYVVRSNTLVSAAFAPAAVNFGIYDQISRPDESSKTNYASLDGGFRVSDTLNFKAQVGTSTGHGETPRQDVSETTPGSNLGAAYTLNGTGAAPDFNFGATDNSTPDSGAGGTPVGFGWIFGVQNLDVTDKEKWAQLDGEFAIDNGAWATLKFGVRGNKHERGSLGAVAQGPTGPGQSTAAYPTGFTNYPSDYSFGSSVPGDVWYWTPSQLASYNSPTNVNRDALGRLYPNYQFNVEEKNVAAYVQADFKGSNWSGNIGVRAVKTKEDVAMAVPTIATDPDAIVGSAFGPFKFINTDHTYNDILPSANLKWSLSNDVVARFAVSKTMTRADYTSLGGFTNLSPPAAAPPGQPQPHGGGTGANPDLKPIRSTNFDAGVEWYFRKDSLLAFSVFYMDLQNYVSLGTETKEYLTYSSAFPNGTLVPYDLTVPVNSKGEVKGMELTYQQALTDNIGVAANYTYADGKQTEDVPTGGDDRLVGTSKNTYNLSAYFENSKINARVTYTYRSAFFSGLDRGSAFSQDAIGALAASVGYTFNEHLSLNLDGQNLNNPTLKYYSLNTDQPRAFYKNGQQYYLSVRYKF